MQRAIGIDLGTTNSCVAIIEGNTPIVIPNQGGYKTTPSMVAITASGKRLVGHVAKRQAITNPENTVFATKRLIGRRWNSPVVRTLVKISPFKIIKGPQQDVRIVLRDNVYSIPEISAMILQEMKLIAENYIGEEANQAVITVPAYFNDNQRQATKDAGKIAGLEVIRIINEPTAAALGYGFGKKIDRQIAVFDLGGGTFDISILEIGKEGVFKVISTQGNTFLGGDDFDQRIINWIIEEFLEENKIDLRQDRMALQRLKEAVERAKCELSYLKETTINLPFIISDSSGKVFHIHKQLTRQTLETLTEDLIERALQICEQAIKISNIKIEEIEDVILVGGQTRMPKIQERVAEFFGREPCKGVHPDEVVALGAAIQGRALLSDSKEIVLLDVTPHTLGIMIVGGYVEELIPLNTSIPTSQSKIFTTIRDNQTAVKILVLQGESKYAEENELLGEFILTGLRKAPKGEVEIEVTFEINANGIVNVSAKDIETGKKQAITITAHSGLTGEELKEMIAKSQEYLLRRRLTNEIEKIKHKVHDLIEEIEKDLLKEKEKKDIKFAEEILKQAKLIIQISESGIETEELALLRDIFSSLREVKERLEQEDLS